MPNRNDTVDRFKGEAAGDQPQDDPASSSENSARCIERLTSLRTSVAVRPEVAATGGTLNVWAGRVRRVDHVRRMPVERCCVLSWWWFTIAARTGITMERFDFAKGWFDFTTRSRVLGLPLGGRQTNWSKVAKAALGMAVAVGAAAAAWKLMRSMSDGQERDARGRFVAEDEVEGPRRERDQGRDRKAG